METYFSKFTSSRPGDQQPEIGVPVQLCSSEGPLASRTRLSSGCVLTGWKGQGSSLRSLLSGTNSIHEGSTFMTKLPLSSTSPNTITLGFVVQHMNFGGWRETNVCTPPSHTSLWTIQRLQNILDPFFPPNLYAVRLIFVFIKHLKPH